MSRVPGDIIKEDWKRTNFVDIIKEENIYAFAGCSVIEVMGTDVANSGYLCARKLFFEIGVVWLFIVLFILLWLGLLSHVHSSYK